MSAPTRQFVAGHGCTCHHPSRHCKYKCQNSTAVVRPSDGRPVCGHCVYCNPEDSAGFGVSECHWAETS